MSLPVYGQPRHSLLGAFLLILFVADATADTLGFEQALQLAQQNSPLLQARQLQIDAERERSTAAGSLPDPQLSGGLGNIPLERSPFSLNSDFMTMRTIGVMQQFPNRAKRDAWTAGARADVLMAETQSHLDAIDIATETAQSWLALYYLDRQLALLDDLEQENRMLTDTVNARLSGGQGSLSDAVAPMEEAAWLDGRRDELLTRRRQQTSRLSQWLGDEAKLPLRGPLPQLQIDTSALHTNLPAHPGLAPYGPRGEQLAALLQQAEATLKPDWNLAVEYASRNSRYGDMLSVRVSVDLPLFATTRQNPRIAARQLELNALEADYAQALRRMRAELDGHLAEYERLVRAIQRQESQFVALAQDRLDLIESSWTNGDATLAAVISARAGLMEAQFRLIELHSERDQLAAWLLFSHAVHVTSNTHATPQIGFSASMSSPRRTQP